MSPTSTPRAVLLVDDDPGILGLMSLIAERAGLVPHCAVDGQDALDLLRSGLDPVAVITDVEMPRMDGIELARSIRADPSLALTRVIVHTGRQRSPELRRLADGWIPKGRPQLLRGVMRAL